MCKAWSDAQKDSAILATVETLRDLNFMEAEIKEKIMAKYNLTEKEAKEYMLKKSA